MSVDATSPRVLVIVSDLLFQARIVDAIIALGGRPALVEDDESLTAAMALLPAAAVVDLHERSLDALAAIRELRRAGVRSLAFGRHTEPALLRSARDGGASAAVPRSQLVEELPELLRVLLQLPTPDPAT